MSTPLKVIKSITVTDAVLTATSVAEADHATWLVGTTYALGVRVILAHKIYESLQAGNLGKAPATEPNWWVEVSPTNRWKLFDLSSTTQTVLGAAGFYEFAPAQAVSAVAMVNISGILTVRVRLTDPSFGVVYDTGVQDITPVPSESSWYAWFFEPRTEQTQFVFSNLPSYPNAVLRIDVTSSGTAYIGALIFGTMRTFGLGVQQGVRLGITDYSRKERNEWGDVILAKRGNSKLITFPLLIANTDLDRTYSGLADLLSTVCIFIGSSRYSSMTVFGFYTSFDIGVQYTHHSECSIDVESFT